MTDFEKLDIWKDSVQLGVEVFRLTREFDRSLQVSLGDQIRRAYLSISSNIAEGSGAQTLPDEIKFLDIAVKSCFECVSQLVFYHELTNRDVANLIERTKIEAMKIRRYRNIRFSYITDRKNSQMSKVSSQ